MSRRAKAAAVPPLPSELSKELRKTRKHRKRVLRVLREEGHSPKFIDLAYRLQVQEQVIERELAQSKRYWIREVTANESDLRHRD